MNQPVVIPLNFGSDGAPPAVTLNRNSYIVSCALVLAQKAHDKVTFESVLASHRIVMRLTPRAADLKIKMRLGLATTDGNQNAIAERPVLADVYGVEGQLDFHNGSFAITAARQLCGADISRPSEIFALWDDAPNLEDTESLQNALRQFVTVTLLGPVQSMFLGLLQNPSELNSEASGLQKLTLPANVTKNNLIPFGMVAGRHSIEIFDHNTKGLCTLTDMYCIKKSCECRDVTCILEVSDDPHSKPVTYGGFRVDVDTGQLTVITDMPTKYNAKESFKRFAAQCPVDLKYLLKCRFDLMRSELAR